MKPSTDIDIAPPTVMLDSVMGVACLFSTVGLHGRYRAPMTRFVVSCFCLFVLPLLIEPLCRLSRRSVRRSPV